MFCSFLALVLKAALEGRIVALGQAGSWHEIIADLDSLTETEIEHEGKGFIVHSAPRPAASLALRAAAVALPPQGCSVLSHMEHLEDFFDIEGGAPAGVADILASRRPDCVVSERAQAGDDVGVLADAGSVLAESSVAYVVAAVLDPPVTPDPFVQGSGVWPEAEETQKTVSSVCLQSPVLGSRLQTVRSSRSTVWMRPSHGEPRNHALAGNTVNSRVSQRLRPEFAFLADPLGLRPADPSSSLRRKLGWLPLTWVSRWLPEAITRSKVPKKQPAQASARLRLA